MEETITVTIKKETLEKGIAQALEAGREEVREAQELEINDKTVKDIVSAFMTAGFWWGFACAARAVMDGEALDEETLPQAIANEYSEFIFGR